jgi:hypothetical protein
MFLRKVVISFFVKNKIVDNKSCVYFQFYFQYYSSCQVVCYFYLFFQMSSASHKCKHHTSVKMFIFNIIFPILLYIQGVPELADQTYSAFSLVITESNGV